MTTTPSATASNTSAELREHYVPGPLPCTGYRSVLMLGTTGAGKTTLVRQLIGTDPTVEPFPATATFKTTTAETEILCAPGIYYAVATFSRRDRIQADVMECAIAAGLAIGAGRPIETAQDALRAHLDQRLRLEYVLGPGDEEPSGWLATSLATIARVVAAAPVGNSCEAIDNELAGHLRQSPAIVELVDDLLELIVGRIQGVVNGRVMWGDDRWPTAWTIASADRADFISAIRRLVGNDRATAGVQLSPLVDGVRVRGPFHPTWVAEVPYLMLVDTVGLGHTPDTAASLPVSVLDQIDAVDRILLVDDGTHPMQAAPSAALQQLILAGHIRKLVLCFTHLDQVDGPAIRSDDDRRALLRRSVEQVVARIGARLDAATTDAVRRHLDHHVVYLGGMHEVLSIDDSTRTELLGLLELLRTAARPIDDDEAIPVYRLGDLRSRVSSALVAFADEWSVRLGLSTDDTRGGLAVAPAHWSQVQALCQRMAVGDSDGYGGWSPVADVHRRLSEAARAFIASPTQWDGVTPSDAQRLDRFDRLSTSIGPPLLALTRLWLIEGPADDWARAAQLHGPGSSALRAETIATEIVGPFSSAAADESFAAAAIGLVTQALTAQGARVADAVVSDGASLEPDATFPAPEW